MTMEKVDLVVIGAGWSGLVAAKTYREVNPASNIVLLDAAASVGGVWAKERIYKGLNSNNLLGTYEYSDFPMDEATFGVKPGQHIPGETFHMYFEKYVDRFQLGDIIRLNSKVESAEHQVDGRWHLRVKECREDETLTVTLDASKLIVATGLTSIPFVPAFDGQDSFGASLFHIRYLVDHELNVLQKGKHVAIFGAGKSAWDAAYIAAESGAQVDWIIRESGHGPVWMAPAYVTPLKKWLEKLVTTRFLTWFSPCVWGDADGFSMIRYFLHGTTLGRKVVDTFWSTLANDVIQLNRYDKHPETKKLKPWISPFWVASGLSILNYPTDIYEHVRKGTIKVHIGDIDHLSAGTIHLSTGEAISTDALICATGWKATPTIKFLPEGIETDLGFPWEQDSIDEDTVEKADKEILRRFPRLKNQPHPNPKFKLLAKDAEAAAPHPFRLARFMLPLSTVNERSIAFLGVPTTINTALVAQTQALWVTAYLSNKLWPSANKDKADSTDSKLVQNPAEDDLVWETVLHTEFGKWRYPGGFGKRNPDFVFDAIPYIDLLLKDLGLRVHRKSGTFAECFEPYGPADYRGLIDEWKAHQNQESYKP